MSRWEGKGHLVFTATLLWMSVLVGGFHLAALVIGGMFLGLGESPYASTISGMLTNLFYVGSILLGIEISRAYLVSVLKVRDLFVGMLLVVVLFGLVLIPPARYGTLGELDPTMRFLGMILVPNLSESLLATFLVFLGGPVAALAYRGVLMGFEWFFPILPDLPWAAKGLIGLFVPVLGVLIVQARYATPEQVEEVSGEAKGVEEAERRGISVFGIVSTALTVMLALVALAIVLLNVGFMGYKSMVVISGSMSPGIGIGDVVITEEAIIEELRVNDVVKYHRGGKDIVHRVIDIDHSDDGILLTTKGDANNTVDRPGATSEELLGRVVMRLPKVGIFTIWVNQKK